MVKIYELHYKPKRTSRVWRKTSLSMQCPESCFKVGKDLQKQENWDRIAVFESGQYSYSLYSAHQL